MPGRGIFAGAAKPGNRRPSENRETAHVNGHDKVVSVSAYLFKVKLPDVEMNRRISKDQATPAEIRDYMKKLGMVPVRDRIEEKPIYISCTGAVIEQYVPPEGDGKVSVLSKEVKIEIHTYTGGKNVTRDQHFQGAKQGVSVIGKKGKSFMAVRNIRKFEETFDPRQFAEEAQEIYIKAHKLLAE